MAHSEETTFRPARVAVITVSDTRTPQTDKSGDCIEQHLLQAGHELVFRSIVKDDMMTIRHTVMNQLLSKKCAFIIITGGTGLTERDVTPEAVTPLYTKHIPGFGELFRAISFADIGTATIQSRADAGLCGHAVVMILPGSTGACTLAMKKIILPQLNNQQKPCNFRSVVDDPA